jgi:NAD+ synthase
MSADAIRDMTKKDADVLIGFIRTTVVKAGCRGAVVGLSGGVDSATVTKLCVDALGPENVLNVFMPTTVTALEDYKSTLDLSRLWKTRYELVDIQPAVDAFTAALFSKTETPLERGNISARCRMVVLYNRAKKLNYLVIGTSNRSELMMGYFTKFGDGACDAVPMIDLYKTQVWQLAKMLGVPQRVIDKVPTAGLWEGQTDEGEMGITYHDLDMILNAIDHGKSDDEISQSLSISVSKVSEVRVRIANMDHKRLPTIKPDVVLDS